MSAVSSRFSGFYLSHRFAVYVRCRAVMAHTIYTDPFTGTLWIGRAHQRERNMLAVDIGPCDKIEVWLLSRGTSLSSRMLSYKFDGTMEVPTDLDASMDDVAMEWLGLKNAVFVEKQDFLFDRMPSELKALIRPPRILDSP